MRVYVGGSLRGRDIIGVTNALTAAGFDTFSGWYGAGPEADDYWQKYEKALGHTYRQALAAPAAEAIYGLDRSQIDLADVFVLVYPAGKSGHTELGYAIGKGKLAFVLMDEPKAKDRWDLMLKFATDVAYHVEELADMILMHAVLGGCESSSRM